MYVSYILIIGRQSWKHNLDPDVTPRNTPLFATYPAVFNGQTGSQID